VVSWNSSSTCTDVPRRKKVKMDDFPHYDDFFRVPCRLANIISQKLHLHSANKAIPLGKKESMLFNFDPVSRALRWSNSFTMYNSNNDLSV